MSAETASKPAKAAKSAPRSAARLAAVQALYQMDVAGTDAADVVAEFCDHRMADESDASCCQDADAAFFAAVVKGVVSDQRRIDPLLNAQLAEGWRLNRIDSILRAILRCAAYELLERKDVPVRVVINEYLDVAHAFFEGEEPRVVNGILDAVARDLRPTEFQGKTDG
jgi:transcription antitermination protein NusB